MQLVVVSAVRKAVSAATIIFTAISISRFFAIPHFSFLIQHSSFLTKRVAHLGQTLCLVLIRLVVTAAVVATASGVSASVTTGVTASAAATAWCVACA